MAPKKPKDLFAFHTPRPAATSAVDSSQFPASLVKRAQKRKVEYVGPNHYRVIGDAKLSDHHPSYTITFAADQDEWWCECYDHAEGHVRARRGACSHIVAVILGIEQEAMPGPLEGQEDSEDDRGDIRGADSGNGGDGRRHLTLVASDGHLRPPADLQPPGRAGLDDGRHDDPQLPHAPADRDDAVPQPAAGIGGRPAGDRAQQPEPVHQQPLDIDAPRVPDGIPLHLRNIRPHQRHAADRAIDQFSAGSKISIIDAPTGSGKSLLGEIVRKELGARAIYLTNSKGLQDQILADFNYAIDIRGRNNYPTLDFPDAFFNPFPNNISCDDCDKHMVEMDGVEDEDGEPMGEWQCTYCSLTHLCPYTVQKYRALRADLVVTNMAYWLTETNKGMGRLANWPLVIIDEVDSLESVLRGQIEVTISPFQQRRLGIGPPQRKTVPETWPEWFDTEAIPAAARYVRELPEPTTPSQRKDLKSGINLLERLTLARRHIDGMIYDYTSGRDRENSHITFKPVTVGQFGPSMIWKHAQKFLLMSATVISPDQLAENLGFHELPFDHVEVPSTFPAANRPIRILPFASMTNKEKDEAWPVMVRGIRQILKYHPNDRTLIHSVSYALTNAIVEGLRGCGRQVFSYTRAADRDNVLEEFKRAENAVLVAPSMDRGVDLPDDMCRVVVVAKVPHLNLGDKQINARLHTTSDGQTWYATETVRSLIQMTGRAVRHADDRATTYICDDQVWGYLRGRWKKFLPKWWMEAVVLNGRWRKEILAIDPS